MLLFFGLPVVFALAAILADFVQVDQWRWSWRHVLTASLFLAVAGGIGLSEFCRRVRSTFARGLVAGLLAMPLFQIAIPSVALAGFDDAQRSISNETRFAMALGEQLHRVYAEGSIALLTGYSQMQRIVISSGLRKLVELIFIFIVSARPAQLFACVYSWGSSFRISRSA